ncbi:porin family protein [Paenimyroides aestuarii]|uniref:PorT family protein n=1 Tax=Paenimyroides aestuarii TaxID=2968490 RepID=A0ABY5NQG8_9FLAO|nr:porin family protein [Paenimyroides aestuarii]UUV20790.1 PorT family protein [Paenimyroides aestuarii]
MKKILLSVAVLATSVAAQAQERTFGFNQGDVLLEGSLQANSEDNKLETVKTSEFNFTPKAGYFINDNFAVGLGLNFGSAKIENYSDVVADRNTQKANNVGFEVFGRYYFMDLNRFQPYGEVGIGYNSLGGEISRYDEATSTTITRDLDKTNRFGVNATLGINYFVTPKIAVNFALSNVIGFNSSKMDTPNAKATTDFYANINNFNNFFDTATFGLTFKL